MLVNFNKIHLVYQELLKSKKWNDAVKKYKPDAVIIVNHQSDYLDEYYSPWNTDENIISSLRDTLTWLDKYKVPAIVQGEIPFCDFIINLISQLPKEYL